MTIEELRDGSFDAMFLQNLKRSIGKPISAHSVSHNIELG